MFSPKAVRVYRVTAAILKVLRGGDSDVTNYDIYRVLYSSVTQIYSDFVSLWIITLTYKARKRRLSGIRISSEPFVWFKFIQFIHTHTHTHTHTQEGKYSVKFGTTELNEFWITSEHWSMQQCHMTSNTDTMEMSVVRLAVVTWRGEKETKAFRLNELGWGGKRGPRSFLYEERTGGEI